MSVKSVWYSCYQMPASITMISSWSKGSASIIMLSSWSYRLNDTHCNVLALLRDLNTLVWHMAKFFNITYIFADNGKILELKKKVYPFLVAWIISRYLFDMERCTITWIYCLSLKLFPDEAQPLTQTNTVCIWISFLHQYLRCCHK